MAASHGQLPGVQAIVPAPMLIVSFRTHVFGDHSKDPNLGHYANLLRPLLIDVNNAGNNLGPYILGFHITAEGANLDPLSVAILHDGVAKVYMCPQNLHQPLGQPHNIRYNKFYVFNINILDNSTYHAILPNDGFDLIPNIILVPSIPSIVAALGGDRGLMEMGPYSAGYVNTKTFWVQIVIPLPYTYVSDFLSNEVTPSFYFETLYPQILTYNRAVDCTALHRLFQVALTVPANGIHSVLNRLPFLPETHNPIIHSMRKRFLHFHLPLLINTQAQSTQNAMAAQIGLLASQQQQYRQIDEQKKVDGHLTTVEKWIGP